MSISVIREESREEFEKLLAQIHERAGQDVRDLAVELYKLGYDDGWWDNMRERKIMICPACEGVGLMKDVDELSSVIYHTCRCCDGIGSFPESELMDRVKDMKTWPDSIRRDHGFKVSS